MAHRTPAWTGFFRAITNLGNPGIAFIGGLALTVFAAFRSLWTAVLILLLTLARPLASTIVKDLIDRSRPPVHALVVAGGTVRSPAGTCSRQPRSGARSRSVLLVWSAARGFVVTATAFAAAAVLVVAVSRVYLGVHWFTDVLGGAALGALLLVPVYRTAVAP